jgi:predicted phage tail protein
MWSAYSTATTFSTGDAPPTVAGVSVSPNPVTQGFSVTASVSGVGDADGTVAYVQYWAESNGVAGLQTGAGGDTLLATAAGSPYGATLSTTGLPLGQQTLYAMAVDNLGTGSTPASTTLTVQPAAGSVTAAATGGRTVHLTWTGGATGVDGFAIERSANGGPFTPVTQVPATQTSFDDSGLTPGTSYTYRLRAISGGVQSNAVTSNATGTWAMGDCDGDGSVTFNDFLILQNNMDQAGGWTQGDFDGNGVVDFNDFLILQNAMG